MHREGAAALIEVALPAAERKMLARLQGAIDRTHGLPLALAETGVTAGGRFRASLQAEDIEWLDAN